MSYFLKTIWGFDIYWHLSYQNRKN